MKSLTYYLTAAAFFMQLHKSLVVGSDRPNIIIIVADDLGFNDVGFHGSTQIPTPNIDALAYSGVILQNYYVQPICTPSRSALLTGKYPIHTGMQGDVIINGHPWALSNTHVLLPQHLGNLGYVSHAIGKWHLRSYREKFTPTSNGFLSYFGYWGGEKDYYDHTALTGPSGQWGYDFRRNMSVAKDCFGKYTTDLFTEEAVEVIKRHNVSEPLFLYLAHLAVHSANSYEPLQAPKEVVENFHTSRTKKEGNLLVKASLWEGGVRGAGFLWSPQLLNPGRVSHQMVHITDWLPTLMTAAGGDISSLGKIDGVDLWNSLVHDDQSPRTDFLVNIHSNAKGAAVRMGDWKLVSYPQGYGEKWDGWFGPSGRNETAPEQQLDVILEQVLNSSVASTVKTIIPTAYQDIRSIRKKAEVYCSPIPENVTKSCDSEESPCLFHIPSDPCEYNNVADLHPDVVATTMTLLKQYNATAIPPRNKPYDPAATPKYWGYTWTNWKDYPQPHVIDTRKLKM